MLPPGGSGPRTRETIRAGVTRDVADGSSQSTAADAVSTAAVPPRVGCRRSTTLPARMRTRTGGLSPCDRGAYSSRRRLGPSRGGRRAHASEAMCLVPVPPRVRCGWCMITWARVREGAGRPAHVPGGLQQHAYLGTRPVGEGSTTVAAVGIVAVLRGRQTIIPVWMSAGTRRPSPAATGLQQQTSIRAPRYGFGRPRKRPRCA